MKRERDIHVQETHNIPSRYYQNQPLQRRIGIKLPTVKQNTKKKKTQQTSKQKPTKKPPKMCTREILGYLPWIHN